MTGYRLSAFLNMRRSLGLERILIGRCFLKSNSSLSLTANSLLRLRTNSDSNIGQGAERITPANYLIISRDTLILRMLLRSPGMNLRISFGRQDLEAIPSTIRCLITDRKSTR